MIVFRAKWIVFAECSAIILTFVPSAVPDDNTRCSEEGKMCIMAVFVFLNNSIAAAVNT